MKGNDREIQRQRIEDRIIAQLDRESQKPIPNNPSRLATIFDLILSKNPFTALRLGNMAGWT